MTAHINANKEDIASTVIMPGDPLRAKYIAEKFLSDVKLVNSVRNMFMFTGFYKGIRVTVAGSGMGFGSMGIYSYELYKFYDVETIIRIGTAGSTDLDLKVNDVVIIERSVGDTDYQLIVNGIDSKEVLPTNEIVELLNETSIELDYHSKKVSARSTDNFYRLENNVLELAKIAKTSVEEMETYALFSNAIATNKKAGAIMTISDEIITGAELNSAEREKNVDKMALLSLETVVKLANKK